jgi:hypothetical protein
MQSVSTGRPIVSASLSVVVGASSSEVELSASRLVRSVTRSMLTPSVELSASRLVPKYRGGVIMKG